MTDPKLRYLDNNSSKCVIKGPIDDAEGCSLVLHRLKIENFYSIRDPQVIDLRASANVPDEPDRLAPLWPGAIDRAPKVVALFGPNAAGKSNVLRALSFIVWFLRNSFTAPPDQWLPYQRFNSERTRGEPTRLGVNLVGPVDPKQIENPDTPKCQYSYEFELGGPKDQAPIVFNEALYYWPSEGGRKTRLFERDARGDVKASIAFGLSGYKQSLEKILRGNASVISTLAQLQHPFATAIWQRIGASVVSNILIQKEENAEDFMIRHYAANPRLVDALNKEIQRVDLGIKAMSFQSGPNNQPTAYFTHEGLYHAMPIILESHGTRTFIQMYPLLLLALETGGIAIIDELDGSIHPMLLPEMLRWFHDPIRNPYNAQLWMTCNNPSLLEYLIKEEIYFCTKDRQGRTEIYGLNDVKSVRRNDNYYRKYLGGIYGALPIIG